MLTRFFHSFQRKAQGTIVIGPSLPIQVTPMHPAQIVVGPSRTVIVRPAKILIVEPPRRGVWLEKGWAFDRVGDHETYQGSFQVTKQSTGQPLSYAGRIEILRQEIATYIFNPPAAIRLHPKGPCFSLIGQSWFRIHWHRPPINVDDAILYVEHILDEVVNRRLQ